MGSAVGVLLERISHRGAMYENSGGAWHTPMHRCVRLKIEIQKLKQAKESSNGVLGVKL